MKNLSSLLFVAALATSGLAHAQYPAAYSTNPNSRLVHGKVVRTISTSYSRIPTGNIDTPQDVNNDGNRLQTSTLQTNAVGQVVVPSTLILLSNEPNQAIIGDDRVRIEIQDTDIPCEDRSATAKAVCMKEYHNGKLDELRAAYPYMTALRNQQIFYPSEIGYVSARSKQNIFGWVWVADTPDGLRGQITYIPRGETRIHSVEIHDEENGQLLTTGSRALRNNRGFNGALNIFVESLQGVYQAPEVKIPARRSYVPTTLTAAKTRTQLQSRNRTTNLLPDEMITFNAKNTDIRMTVPADYVQLTDTLTMETGELTLGSRRGIITLRPTDAVCVSQDRSITRRCLEQEAEKRSEAHRLLYPTKLDIRNGENIFISLTFQDRYTDRIGRLYTYNTTNDRTVGLFYFASPYDGRIWELTIDEVAFSSQILDNQVLTQRVISSLFFDRYGRDGA